jgi:hypothetical protein
VNGSGPTRTVVSDGLLQNYCNYPLHETSLGSRNRGQLKVTFVEIGRESLVSALLRNQSHPSPASGQRRRPKLPLFAPSGIQMSRKTCSEPKFAPPCQRSAVGKKPKSPGRREFPGLRSRGVTRWCRFAGSAYPSPTHSSVGASRAGTMLPSSHPAHRTGCADFPLPALGERFTMSPTGDCSSAW